MAGRFKTSTSGKGNGQRPLRVGEEIRHALAAAFQRGDFPWDKDSGPRPVITVTEVRISPDLRNATAFIMPLGGTRMEEAVKMLNKHSPFFKHVIAQNVQMRYVPALQFSADQSFEYAEKIEKILHDPKVARDLEEKS